MIGAFAFKLLMLVLPLYGKFKYFVVFVTLSFPLIAIFNGKLVITNELKWFFYAIFYSIFALIINISFESVSSAISWIILFSMLVVLTQPNIKHEKLLLFLLYFAIFCSIDALYQYVYKVDLFGIPICCLTRTTGPFTWGSPVISGLIMTLFFLPSVLNVDNKLKVLLYILFLLALISEGSRGALLQIIFVFFIFKLNNIQKILSIIVVVLIAVLFLNIDAVDQYNRQLLIFDIERLIEYESRPDGRIPFWIEYMPQALKDNFLFGAGLGGVEVYLRELTIYSQHPHHLYFEIFLTFGIIGVFFLFRFTVMLLSNSSKNEKMIFFSFFGPFNALHSIFDFYWGLMMFVSILMVILAKKNRRSVL